MSNLQLLISNANNLGINLTKEQIKKFLMFQNLLIEWNKRFNLTAIQEPKQIQKRHFFDSLTCVLATGDLNGKSVVDVGTGAGFPGIPLKICYPELELVLLESIHKKTEFLKRLVSDLDLKGVRIYPERAETFSHVAGQRESFDWAIARAVAPLPVLVEYLLPLARIGGNVLAQKGEGAATELSQAQDAIIQLGGGQAELIRVDIGEGEMAWLVKIPKEKKTPEKYPRRPGIPAKRPLT